MHCNHCGHNNHVTARHVLEERPAEPVGTLAPGGIHLVKGNRTRSLEEIRRDLLEAHKAHVDASAMAEAADTVARQAAHNVTDKLARITQLRDELTRTVEAPTVQELGG